MKKSHKQLLLLLVSFYSTILCAGEAGRSCIFKNNIDCFWAHDTNKDIVQIKADTYFALVRAIYNINYREDEDGWTIQAKSLPQNCSLYSSEIVSGTLYAQETQGAQGLYNFWILKISKPGTYQLELHKLAKYYDEPVEHSFHETHHLKSSTEMKMNTFEVLETNKISVRVTN